MQEQAYLEQLYEYLSTYQSVYHYTTVFCVSALSGNYYYQKGFNKTIQEEDEHDVWYYNFLALKQPYDIQVDTDEINSNTPTIFINQRVQNAEGQLLGVVGVAVELTDIQEMLNTYESDFGLTIRLVNRGGASNSFSQDMVHFIEPSVMERILMESGADGLTDSESGGLYWKINTDESICIVDVYSDQLKWNIVAEKYTDSMKQVFINKLISNIVAVIAILFACCSMSWLVFYSYKVKIMQLENTDELTGLPNRKLFQKQYVQFAGKNKYKAKTLFMLDIDYFKQFNDTRGHLFGNVVLKLVGTTTKEVIGEHGIAARWGGDEFIGIMTCDLDQAEELLTILMKRLGEGDAPVTLSIGLMEIIEAPSLAENMSKVDNALYKAKYGGRNQIVRYLPES